jgi:hypothetical protein
MQYKAEITFSPEMYFHKENLKSVAELPLVVV